EEGNVCAQTPRQRLQAVEPEADAPPAVQRHQHGGRVAAAAAEPARDRYALGDRDLHSAADARVLLEEEGGAHGEVPLVQGDVGVVAADGDALPARAQHDVVVQVDRLEQRAQ